MRLIKGDCLIEMDKLIKDGVKVDLTVTSPPYDNLRTYDGSLEWNENIWKQVIEKLYNITTDGGVVVWVVGDATINGSETGTSFKQALYFKEVGFRLHDTMIYQKINYMPINSGRYENAFEYMFIMAKGKPKTFNPIKTTCKMAGKIAGGTQIKQNGERVQKWGAGKKCKDFKTINNIWQYGVGGKGLHPAVFPEKLANDHIISWSNEKDTVFDPFMGSGTTGKMAKINNRHFIGIEKVDKYFEIAKKRIEETTSLFI